MPNECSGWILECREAFPKLNRHAITCEYKKLGKTVLGRVKGQVTRFREINPESVFLKGEGKSRLKIKEEHRYEVMINEKIKKAKPDELRKQVVQNIIIHELLHVENKDLTALSKKYSKRKKKKIHIKDFDKECLKRFNEIRGINKMAPIKSLKQLQEAEEAIVRKLKI